MTKDEFQRRYHDYRETELRAAMMEANRVNAEAEGFTVEVVGFGKLGFALMLESAAALVRESGIV